MTERPPEPNPADVRRLIDYLTGLADQSFAEALADNIMEPDPAETQAFRSEELAPRSLAAARYLIDNVNTQLRRNADESGKAWALRAEHFRTRVGMERRLIEAILAGMRAQKGMLPNAPNPRRRAQERLWSENMRGPVPAGRFRELLEEEEAQVEEKRRIAKEERKKARREAKARERAERPPR